MAKPLAPPDAERRDFINLASTAFVGVGVVAIGWPLVDQMNPDASVQALASVEIDISGIEPGQGITAIWRGKPIFIRHRTAAEIDAARAVSAASLPDPAEDAARVKEGHDAWLVMIGICTHLGCVPLGQRGDYDGWFCPCHGSHYDTSGRIRKGPAPSNLALPPYEFVSDARIKIG